MQQWQETMKIIWYAFLHFYVFPACCAMEQTTSPIIISTTGTTEILGKMEKDEEQEEEQKEIEAVPMTEQVMDANIKITDVPDVEETTEDWDANWDKNKVIRDVAYYIRAHKFQDYDRRYYKRLEDSPSRLYEEFPKPPLRSLHWEVRRHCEVSFVECLKYIESIVKLTALKREDDIVTIMREQKWNLANNAKQIQAAQKDCLASQRRDDLTMPPFQGPIAHRECTLNRQENRDFPSLVANRINISCECPDPGYEWSSRFGLCVDVNECARGEHGCSTEDGETCVNLPGGYECVCKFGYIYDPNQRECVFSSDIQQILLGWKEESNVTEKKSIIDTIVKAIARSPGNRLVTSHAILCTVIVQIFSYNGFVVIVEL